MILVLKMIRAKDLVKIGLFSLTVDIFLTYNKSILNQLSTLYKICTDFQIPYWYSTDNLFTASQEPASKV